MTFGWKLILWASMIWLLPLMYFLIKNEFKPKKNIIMGVTLPYAAQDDPEVKALLDSCGREMKLTFWLSLAAAVPNFLFMGFGAFMTYWLTWIVVICFVFFIPYIRCNTALKALKARRGWRRDAGALQAVADLKAAAIEIHWISPWWFLPPFLVSLLPLFFERDLWWMLAIDALLVPVFYLCYRYLYRNRAEAVDADSQRTIALTRVRRYNWGRFWLVMAWATGLFNVGLWLTLDHVWLCMAVTLLYGLVACAEAISTELRVRRLQEKLTENCGPEVIDEDDHWIWGLFYYNPNDSRMLINARVGVNTTVNLAKRPARILMGFVLALLLACPLMGVWLMGMEYAPVELTATATELTGSHYNSRWSVALEDIEKMEVVTDLPRMRRVAGTGMDNALTGQFNADGWGRLTLCIDPRQGPWLLLTKKDGSLYLFGSSESGAAAEIAAQVRTQ